MPTRKPRRTRQQWQSLIDKYNQSQSSPEQFCEAQDVTLVSLHKWRRKLSSADACKSQTAGQSRSLQSDSATSGFGPVTISTSPYVSEGACLELPGNIRLHTQSMPSVDYLHNLVRRFGNGY